MKRIKLLLVTILLLSVLISGCGSTVPELSEDEQAYVTEYATGLLMKYSTVVDRELLNEMRLEREMAKEAEERERYLKTQELAKLYLQEESNQEVKEDEDSNTEEEEQTNSVPQRTVSEFFAEDSISIDYASYELCKSYPKESGEEFFMAMDATAGHQLCIVKFNVTNLSTSEQSLDMLNKQGRFSLRMNDSKTISAQSTLLMDDLSAFVGTIPAGATQELVLVFEVPDDIAQMDSMDLIMRDASGENILTLQ